MKWVKNKRSKLAIKNILISTFLKGVSIIISFFLVPLTLGYLNSYEYGIWLTLNSVLSWVYLFDIGLGNGLRNKLTEALAIKNYNLGRIYVSTTFFFMGLIVVSFYSVFLITQNFINWYDILNVSVDRVENLNSLVTIVFGCVCVGFVFRMIGNVYMAYQLPAANDLLSMIGSLISLIVIFILSKTTDGSLASVAITFSAVPALVYLLAFPITFIKYKEIAPRIRCVRLKYFRSLISLGGKFFFIQIACIILFLSSNLIISNLFGPEEVTPYNIAYKYFSIITIGFNIIIAPIWSAVTDAFIKEEYDWIERTVKNLLKLWLFVVAGVLGMIIVAPYAYDIWIGKDVQVPISLTILCGVYVALTSLCNIFSFVINGFGKVRVQLYFSFLQACIYIPLAILCGNCFGVKGILIALSVVVALSLLWSPYQTFRLLNRKATGIWNK